MRFKVLLGVTVVVVSAMLAGGATMALFTDTDQNVNNTFTAGTVNITSARAHGDPIPGPMFYVTEAQGVHPGSEQLPSQMYYETGVWWPGRSVPRNLTVTNVGSLAVRLTNLSAEITSINYPAVTGSFAANMHVKIYVASMLQPAGLLYNGPLTALLGPGAPIVSPANRPTLAANGGNLQLVYEVTMLPTAGNNLQGVHAVISFHVQAEQTINNPWP